MDAISETTLSNAFSWMKMLEFRLRFHWCFVPKGPVNNNPALVQIMAWRRSDDKPLSEPMMVSLLTHICVTRPQWVNPRLTRPPLNFSGGLDKLGSTSLSLEQTIREEPAFFNIIIFDPFFHISILYSTLQIESTLNSFDWRKYTRNVLCKMWLFYSRLSEFKANEQNEILWQDPPDCSNPWKWIYAQLLCYQKSNIVLS